MQNDENTNDTQVETQESETETVEETATEGQGDETPEAKIARLESEAAKWRRLFEKKQQPKEAVLPKEPQKTSPNVEETVLLAQGVSEELIDELKLRAGKYGGSLIKAQKDPNFIAVKERLERELKQKEASLPASRGAGQVKAQKTLTTPGLSRDEHKRMTLEKLN